MSRPQSVKDALADAETLRRVALELSPRGYWRSNIAYASRCTWMGLEFWRSRGEQPEEFMAVAFAFKAARAAFRAVPALRGQE